MNNDEDIEEARRQQEQRQTKMTDERTNNAKAILKKMTENKKLMTTKVDKVVLWKITTSKSKNKSKNKGRSNSKREQGKE